MLSEKSRSTHLKQGGQEFRGRSGRGSARSRGYKGIRGALPHTMHTDTEMPSKMDSQNQTKQGGSVGRGRVSRPWIQN